MIKYPLVIPQFNLESNTWTEREFLTQRDFLSFVEGKWKLPGQYNLKRTDLWRQPAIKFQTDKIYCDFHEQSEDYKDWWRFEKKKTKTGVIFNIGTDEFYVTGDYYWYLNFIQIDDQLLGREEFPEVWDSDYHFFLYVMRCELRNMNSCVVKKRRSGYSLKHVAMLMKDLWFVRNSVSKMIAYEEDAVSGKNGSWKFVEAYRNFLNTNTPWYRSFDPDEKLNWKQQQVVVEGDVHTRKVYKGLMSTITAATCKKDVAKSVGGKSNKIFWEESGKNPRLDAGVGYANDTAKLGSVKTGIQFVSGAVGELKDCKPLEKYALDPETNGFLGVEDIFSDNPQGNICFFVPDYWNYVGYDEEEGDIIKCYDEDGNSNIELAKSYILKEDVAAKKQGESEYRLWKSQHPWSLQDAFAMREENPFPVDLIKEHQTLLVQTYKPLTVEIKKEEGKLKTHFIEGFPVRTLKVDPHKDNRGCIEIFELPVSNPPWGLYYAGIDPIAAKNTSTSKSLQSVTVYKAIHYVGDKLVMDYPVAQYTGRHPKWEDTYRTSLDLMHLYNTRTCVENNISDFIEWCIKQGESKYLMRRKEVTMLNEMVPNSTIRDEIGVRMEGEFKKKALRFLETYVDEIIGTEFEEDGTSHYIYGVTRIKDVMILEEFLKFNPRLNTDRCFPMNTKILTPTGYKFIQNIDIGTEVISPDLTINKVFQIHKNSYKGDMYSFRIVGQYNKLVCTEEHPIFVGRYLKKPSGAMWNQRRNNIDVQEYIPAKELKKGDKVFIPKRTLTEDFNLSKEFLYLAGWVFGDGYLSQRHKGRIQITLGENEEHLAKQLVDLMNDYFPNTIREVQGTRSHTKPFTYKRDFSKHVAHYKKSKYKKAINVIFHNRPLYDLLVKHTGYPHNKYISPEIFNNVNCLYFISGCFASDGYLKKGKSYDNGAKRYGLELTSVYEEASLQIRQMLLDNDIWCTIRKCTYKHRGANFNDQYKIEIQDETGINKIGNIYNCYPKVEYERKTNLRFYIPAENGYWVSIKEVSQEYQETEVYNIAVENTNTYVAENIAVHNCISMMLALLAARSNTNRNIIVETRSQDYTPRPKQKLIIPSQFQQRPQSQRLILPNQFKRK